MLGCKNASVRRREVRRKSLAASPWPRADTGKIIGYNEKKFVRTPRMAAAPEFEGIEHGSDLP